RALVLARRDRQHAAAPPSRPPHHAATHRHRAPHHPRLGGGKRAPSGMTAPRILCAGMAVLDEVFLLPHLPAANTKAQASAFAAVVGGCAANAAVAIARLGGAARLAAALGDPARDEIGDRVLAGLAREGVACPGVVRLPGATST